MHDPRPKMIQKSSEKTYGESLYRLVLGSASRAVAASDGVDVAAALLVTSAVNQMSVFNFSSLCSSSSDRVQFWDSQQGEAMVCFLYRQSSRYWDGSVGDYT
jgi:hypothetical protein